MHHSHRIAARCCHDIKFFIRFGKIVLQNCHTENRSSRGYIAGTPCHAVRCRHACTSIALRRTHRYSSLQRAGGIKQLCAFFGQRTRIFACHQNFRQNIPKFPAQFLRLRQRIKLCDHILIKLLRRDVDREHTGSLAHAEYLPAA